MTKTINKTTKLYAGDKFAITPPTEENSVS